MVHGVVAIWLSHRQQHCNSIAYLCVSGLLSEAVRSVIHSKRDVHVEEDAGTVGHGTSDSFRQTERRTGRHTMIFFAVFQATGVQYVVQCKRRINEVSPR